MQHLAVFGSYSDHDLYMRNRVLVNLLAAQADRVTLIRPPVRRRSAAHALASAGGGWPGRIRQALGDLLALFRQRRQLADCDVVFVPYPAYLDVVLLALLPGRRSRYVVVDAFLDLYTTVVSDRGLLRPRSLAAWLLQRLEAFALRRANLILIDTQQQAATLSLRYRLAAGRVVAVPVGIDEQLWQALSPPPPSGVLRAVFWGTFIPLHGVETIVGAARLLDERGVAVHIDLIGDGQTAPDIAAQLAARPVRCLRWRRALLDTAGLRETIAAADVVLGIFGASEKADAVVPYKVQQALASDRPVITRDSAALAHVDESPALLRVPAADVQELAGVLQDLSDASRPAPSTARALYDRYFSNQLISEELRRALASRGTP